MEQLLQLDSAIVTVCAARFARLRTNRANYASQVKHMFHGRATRARLHLERRSRHPWRGPVIRFVIQKRINECVGT